MISSHYIDFYYLHNHTEVIFDEEEGLSRQEHQMIVPERISKKQRLLTLVSFVGLSIIDAGLSTFPKRFLQDPMTKLLDFQKHEILFAVISVMSLCQGFYFLSHQSSCFKLAFSVHLACNLTLQAIAISMLVTNQ